jgi:hypothetical protein
LRLFEVSRGYETFCPQIGNLTNKPVIVPISQLLESAQHLHYECHIHWSSSLRTLASAVQFLHVSIIPFLEIDNNEQSRTLAPKLLPTPGCVIPEIRIKFRERDCYIGSFHVSEHSLRLIIAQPQVNDTIETEMAWITIDLECEKISFSELLELKSQGGVEAYEQFQDCLYTIVEEKEITFKNNSQSFTGWLEKNLRTIDRDWLDLYVISFQQVKTSL